MKSMPGALLMILVAAVTGESSVGVSEATSEVLSTLPLKISVAIRSAVQPDCGSSEAARVVELTNEERAKIGLPALECSPRGTLTALQFSEFMCLDSCGLECYHDQDGRSPGDRLEANGLTDLWSWGENIAFGYRSPDAVMLGWMQSTGHRENILYPEFTHIGVGYVDCEDGWTYWTMVLFEPASPEEPFVVPEDEQTSEPEPETESPDNPAPEEDCGGSEATQVVELTNEERAKIGLPALECSPRGTLTALQFSEFMCLDSCGLECYHDQDGRSPGDRLEANGLDLINWGENIAFGYRSPDAVMLGWMQSTGHRENILYPAFTHIGVGYVNCEDGWTYWTMVLFRPGSAEEPLVVPEDEQTPETEPETESEPTAEPTLELTPEPSPETTPKPPAPKDPPPQLFGCFPGDSRVEVQNKGSIAMKDLTIGDMVKVDRNAFSQVYSFGHLDATTEASYLSIKTGLARPLVVSKDHLLFLHGIGAVPASAVSVGSKLQVIDGTTVVESVIPVTGTGLYAPFTKAGTIVVDDVVSSSYVSLQPNSSRLMALGDGVGFFDLHTLSHMYEAPHRLICEVAPAFCISETYSEEGISSWVVVPLSICSWVLQQNGVVLALFLVSTLPVVLVAAVLEVSLRRSWCCTVLVVACVVTTRCLRCFFQLRK